MYSWMRFKVMSRRFILVLKLSSVESYPQKWDETAQFGIHSKFQNAVEKLKALFEKREILRTDNGCENDPTSANTHANVFFFTSGKDLFSCFLGGVSKLFMWYRHAIKTMWYHLEPQHLASFTCKIEA